MRKYAFIILLFVLSAAPLHANVKKESRHFLTTEAGIGYSALLNKSDIGKSSGLAGGKLQVGYEWNLAENADENGLSYDVTLPAGNRYLYGGAGVEYFPLGNDRLRLHLAYFRDNHDHVHNLDLGVTWRFTVYKRKTAE